MLRIVLAITFFCVPSVIYPANFYFSGEEEIPIEISTDSVVVEDLTTAFETQGAWTLLSQMGFSVISGKSFSESEALGHPVFFSDSEEAQGILTNEVVISSDEIPNLKHMDGFIELFASGIEGVFRARFDTPMRALHAANQLHLTEGIEFAHPNFLLSKTFRMSPARKEPNFQSQWHLENRGQRDGSVGADIHVLKAWKKTMGDPKVTIAVLDGGFEIDHPEMREQWQKNLGDSTADGKDNDGNGYMDDIWGWNFYTRNGRFDSGPDRSHGVAVAGLVNAKINRQSVVGVCPYCRTIPIVVAWSALEDAEAFLYAASRGADIMTNSWGYSVGTPTTQVVEKAIHDASVSGRDGKGAIILFAMNNIHQDDCTGSYPDISSLPSVVAVSASSDLDVKVHNSAFGECMELLSPSYEYDRSGITTTDLQGENGYNNGKSDHDHKNSDITQNFGGTSAATPIAAGVFGLLISQHPEATRDQLLEAVLSSATKIEAERARYNDEGFSQSHGYGRIHAAHALDALDELLNLNSTP